MKSSSPRQASNTQSVTRYVGIILCMRPANERRRYNVTSSLTGWAYAQNDLWENTKINPCVEFISGNINIHLNFIESLYTEIAQVVDIFLGGRQGRTCVSFVVKTKVPDALATQGARAWEAMALTLFCRNMWFSAPDGLVTLETKLVYLV